MEKLNRNEHRMLIVGCDLCNGVAGTELSLADVRAKLIELETTHPTDEQFNEYHRAVIERIRASRN